MKARLLNLWEMLTTNYWLIPALMTAGAIGFAFLSSHWDASLSQKEAQKFGWIWVGSPAGAREVLSVIAGSMITVAGVTFSITIVALAQASSQFGPLLLRNFMNDRGNQFVLGTFVATFIYCLLILRIVHDDGIVKVSVPHLSVTCGIVLAVISLAVLIFFIHHVCEALQAENLVARVGRELESTIAREFPEEEDQVPGEEQPVAEEFPPPSPDSFKVCAKESGYIQAIDSRSLVECAAHHQTRFILERHAGDFVAQGNTLLRSEAHDLPEDSLQKCCRCFILGRHRTPTQDADYAIHQLVQIAVRALSAGINDSFTAITCVDWLGSALTKMAGRKAPSGCLRDDSGEPRVLWKAPSFPRMLEAAFNQIRQNAKNNVAVSIRLLETLARIATQVCRPEHLRAISDQAAMIISDCEQNIDSAWDIAAIREAGRKVLAVAEDGPHEQERRGLFSWSRN